MRPDEIRQRSLARADWLDDLAAKLRKAGEHEQAEAWSIVADELRECAK